MGKKKRDRCAARRIDDDEKRVETSGLRSAERRYEWTDVAGEVEVERA